MCETVKAPLPVAIERRFGDSDKTRQMITDSVAMGQAIDHIARLEGYVHTLETRLA